MYHSLSCECEQHDKLHKSRSHCSAVLYWITMGAQWLCKHSFSITQSVCALSLFEVSDVNHKIWIVSGMLLSILDASTHFYISLKIKVCHGMMTVTMETSNGNISKSGSRDMWHETSSQYKRTLPAHLLWRTSAGTLPWITQAFRWAVWRVTTRSAAEGCLWKETGRNVIQM